MTNIAFIIVITQNQKILPDLLKSNYENCKKILKNNIIYVLSAFLLIILLFIIKGKVILSALYGQQVYSQANLIFILLMLGNSFIAAGAVYGSYITAKGHQKLKIKMMLEASAITFISLLFFNRFGIYGAAISFDIAAIYAGIRFVFCAEKLLRQQKEQK